MDTAGHIKHKSIKIILNGNLYFSQILISLFLILIIFFNQNPMHVGKYVENGVNQ